MKVLQLTQSRTANGKAHAFKASELLCVQQLLAHVAETVHAHAVPGVARKPEHNISTHAHTEEGGGEGRGEETESIKSCARTYVST